jgi:hypothetical protein
VVISELPTIQAQPNALDHATLYEAVKDQIDPWSDRPARDRQIRSESRVLFMDVTHELDRKC